MNKNMKKMVVATLACIALCGNLMAAPGHNGGKPPAPARQHQKAPAPRPAPNRQHKVVHHPAPAPVRHPVHHPAPPPPPPRHIVVHHECHEGANGLVVLGAAVIGGIVGALCN